MAVPKTSCSNIVETFKEFLWGGALQVKKWDFVSWPNLTKHNMEEGMGLRDPYILNQVMGAKLWWHWIGGDLDLWKQIGTRQYKMTT